LTRNLEHQRSWLLKLVKDIKRQGVRAILIRPVPAYPDVHGFHDSHCVCLFELSRTLVFSRLNDRTE